MRFAVGRLRFSVGLSSSLEVVRETLYEKALAHAEKSLEGRYPPKTVRSFGVEKVIHQEWWRHNGLLESRTATLIAERNAVLNVLDGRPLRSWSGCNQGRVPHWRWHKRRLLEVELCNRGSIDKWW